MSGGTADIRVGDIVNRITGCADRHVVTRINAEPGHLPDLVETRCIVSDGDHLGQDGSFFHGPTYQVGQTDRMCADDVTLIQRATNRQNNGGGLTFEEYAKACARIATTLPLI